MKRTWIVVAGLVLLACGGGAEADPSGGTEASVSSSAAAEDERGGEESASAAEPEEQPVRTITAERVPDPCRLLTGEDAAELLGQPVGPPRTPDAGGYPCVYRGEDGSSSRIVLNMSLMRGPSVEHSGLGVRIEHCKGEVVAEPEGLGRRAALFHWKGEDCGSDTFWVSTGIYFEGTEPSPVTGRNPEGYIHFTLSLSPVPDRATLVEKLTTAAERALARLPD